MGPYYISLCREVQRPVDETLADKMKAANKAKLQVNYVHVQTRTE